MLNRLGVGIRVDRHVLRRKRAVAISFAPLPIEPGDPIGTPVGTASVVNSDDTSHAYALVTNPGGLFQIDGSAGAITLAAEAVAGNFELYIQATGNPSGDVLLRRVPLTIVTPQSAEASSILPHILLNQQQLGITL